MRSPTAGAGGRVSPSDHPLTDLREESAFQKGHAGARLDTRTDEEQVSAMIIAVVGARMADAYPPRR